MKIPQTKHWAIIEVSSITIPGDQRSREAPGHGYPEHQEEVVKYTPFTDERDWKNAIREMMKSSWRDFTAVEVIPATIVTSVTVEKG